MSFLNSSGYSVQSQFAPLFRNSSFCGYLNSPRYSVQSQFTAIFKTHILFRHIIPLVIAFNRNSHRYYVSIFSKYIIQPIVAFNRNSRCYYILNLLKIRNSLHRSVKSQLSLKLRIFF